MALGVLDLSIVTDQLLHELKFFRDHGGRRIWTEEGADGTPAWEGALPGHDLEGKFHIEFTGLPPQEARQLGDCAVSLYLFHVAPDATYRNTFPGGGRARTIPEQPLALTLHYLLSAHSPNSYVEEQQAMSIALKYLHDHPIMRAVVPIDQRVQEFTLTMEPTSVDDIGRLWLSFATPLALSAVYRASVIFISPETPERPDVELVKYPTVLAIADCPPTTALPRMSTDTDRVEIKGEQFEDATISLTIREFAFTIVPESHALGPGEARVVTPPHPEPPTMELRLPKGTPRGRYVLRIELTPNTPYPDVGIPVVQIQEVEIELLLDVQ